MTNTPTQEWWPFFGNVREMAWLDPQQAQGLYDYAVQLEKKLEQVDNELLAEIVAKNEARSIANGLLRLARASVNWETRTVAGIDAALAALPEWVRKAVEE